MPPKKAAAAAPPASPTAATASPASASAPVKSAAAAAKAQAGTVNNLIDIGIEVWQRYEKETPLRAKAIDAFMGFLMVVGVLQFLYCVLVGNYPFNAFLSGFSATVGQFVLTASLRMQTNPANKAEFRETSDERAFADFVFGSLILHFFCVNFIN